jgi:plasmid stabilization system protein ParE
LGLREARQLLQAFPLSGAATDPRSESGPRRLILRRLPFVIWYVAVPHAREVRLLRLFHVRQRGH